MRKIILRILIWYLWKKFHHNIKKVVGYKSLDTLNYDLNNLEKEIKNDNEIPVDQKKHWIIQKNQYGEISIIHYIKKIFPRR